MRYLSLPLLILCAATALSAPTLSKELARKRISEFAQSKLVLDAIEIRRILPDGADGAIAETTITLAFQFKKDDRNNWTVDAVRLGDRDWVTMTELLAAIHHGKTPPVSPANAIARSPTPPTERFHVNSSDFEKQRQIMVELGASPLVPDAIEIRRVISHSDMRSIVESTVTMGFRFKRGAKPDWQIDAARLGDREWVETKDVVATLNEGRRRDTVAMMEKLAAGIRNYQAKKGSLPPAKDITELTNILHPDYMTDLVRLDGWGQAFEYNGSGSAFRVVSRGADGRWGTADDIAVDGNSPPRP